MKARSWLRPLGALAGAAALVTLGFFGRMAFEIGEGKAPGGPGGFGHRPGGGSPMGSSWGPGGADALPTSRPARDLVAVEAARAILTTIRERVEGSGVLESEREVTITSRVDGQIEAIHVEEGDVVKTGHVLCDVDRKPLEIAKALAEAQRDRDQAEHERMLELKSRNIASDAELDAAKYAFKISSASYEQAVLDLSFSQPWAPFDGTVIKRLIEKGQHVSPGDDLFILGDFEPLRLRLYLPEEDVKQISIGQDAELRPDRASPPIARGVVERISPVVDRSSLTVEVLVSFVQIPAGLRPGSFAHVDIITRVHENVVLVPRSAVLRTGDTPHVFSVHEDRALRVPVVTGYEDDDVVEIREGIEAESLVVVEGHQELEDHDRVRVHRLVPVHTEGITVGARGG